MQTKFSSIIAGTMLWGKWGRKMSQADMADMIHTCFENGIDSFDHADIYGEHTTEGDFGQAWIQTGIDRSQLKFITKCGIRMKSENLQNRVKHYSYHKAYIIECCERSLKNLKTDYLDLFLLHRPSPLMDPMVIADAISTLLAQGKIRQFGVSNFTPFQTELIRQQIPIEYNQISFSLTECHPMTDDSLNYMMIHRIKPMAWAPLGSYFKSPSEKTARIKEVLQPLSIKYETQEDILLYNWILQHPAGIIPVVGTSDKAKIGRLPSATTFRMEDQDWFALWEASMGKAVP